MAGQQQPELPTLGLGASLSLTSRPDPLELTRCARGPDFVEYAGLVDVGQVQDQVTPLRHAGVPLLFHPSYINFCGSYPNSAQWLAATAQHIEQVGSPWFAQDCAYCFWQEDAGYSGQLGYFVPPIFNRESLELAVQRVLEVKAAVPVPLAIEPPPLTFFIGTMPLFKFFGELAERADVYLLLDMGHLVSYEMASGRSIHDSLGDLPVERVIEVHVAGGKLRQGEYGPIYVDAHESTVLDQTWQMFERFLPLLPNIKAVCLECEGVNEQDVLSRLEQVRHKIQQFSISQELVSRLGKAA